MRTINKIGRKEGNFSKSNLKDQRAHTSGSQWEKKKLLENDLNGYKKKLSKYSYIAS